MTKKAKATTHITPMGVASYPWVTKPDTKFNADGEYSISLTFRDDDAAITTLLNQELDKSLEKAKEENQGKKIKQADSPVVENDDGTITLKFKLKAKVTPKNGEPFEQRPALFDSKNKPLGRDVKIGGGSKVKVAFEVIPFYTALVGAGISLRLKAVQLIDLVEYAGGDGGSYGFGETDGYEAQASEKEESGGEVGSQEPTIDF